MSYPGMADDIILEKYQPVVSQAAHHLRETIQATEQLHLLRHFLQALSKSFTEAL